MPSTHARFSPSAANRRLHCPPSLMLEEQFQDEESIYAAEGSAGHAMAEHLIKKHLKQRTRRPVSDYYSDELLEAVDEYVSFVQGEIEEARRVCKDPVFTVEQRVDASEYVEGCFGTADMVIVTDGYIHIIDLKLGRGVQVFADHNEQLKMTVDRDERGQLYYSYQRGTDEAIRDKNQTVILRPSDVLHIPGLGFDGLVGYSPIAMAKNAIGMAIACEEYGAKFFANGAAPGGILEHPGTIKDPQRVRESWQSTFGGSGNANKIAVLEEGMKYTPIGISPEQAQFLETRKFQINEIARIFRVPPHMVGDLEKSSFSNIEQQSLEFVKYTLEPWVIRWEQSIQRTLLTEAEKTQYFVKFNLEGLLRGDYQSRMNGYATARQNGWMSANDIRELENLDRIPVGEGGDLYLINGNMLPLKDAGAFADTITTGEEDSDEKILELESEGGGGDGPGGTDAVPQRHHRRG